jgi:hypothetical protein
LDGPSLYATEPWLDLNDPWLKEMEKKVALRLAEAEGPGGWLEGINPELGEVSMSIVSSDSDV